MAAGAKPGDTVLLAPACASFDQFQSYEHRGRVFKELVNGLQDMAQRLKTDWILFTTVVLMVLFGALMVYSASRVVADIRMGSSYYFALRQLIWIAIAIPLMMFFKRLHYRKLQTPAVAFTAMGVVMILLAVAYISPTRGSTAGFASARSADCSLLNSPSPRSRCSSRTSSRCVRARSTAATRCCPRFWRSGFITIAVVVADLGTAIVLVSHRRGDVLAWRVWNGAISRSRVVIGRARRACVAVAAKPYRLARVVSYVDPQFKIVDKYRQARLDSRADEEVDHGAGYELSVGAGEDRGGFRRADRARV